MGEKRFKKLLEKIGCGLTQLRKQKGYDTVKDFAAHHSLPGIQYWRIEKGKANIRFNTLLMLLSIHGITLDEFFALVKESC